MVCIVRVYCLNTLFCFPFRFCFQPTIEHLKRGRSKREFLFLLKLVQLLVGNNSLYTIVPVP